MPDPRNHRELQHQVGNRRIQLVVMGASVGTALSVSIGQALQKAGPAGQYNHGVCHQKHHVGHGQKLYGGNVYLYALTVSGGFVCMAGNWVDNVLGFMANWDFFIPAAIVIG